MAKYRQEIVDTVRSEWSAGGASLKELANKYSVSFNTVVDWCVRGKRMTARKPKAAGKEQATALDMQVGGSHYKNMAIQPVVYITANNLGFCEGNVVKYVTRWREKGGVDDLRKARHYLDLLIEQVVGGEGK